MDNKCVLTFPWADLRSWFLGLSSIGSQAENIFIPSVHLFFDPIPVFSSSVSSYHNPYSVPFTLSHHLRCAHTLTHTHVNLPNYLLCASFFSPSFSRPLLPPVSLCIRLWTRWLLTWMWRSAAFLWCPGTARRTAAWTSCRQTAPWPSWSPQRERAAITSTPHSPTASYDLLPLWWHPTLCQAPPPTSGDSCTTTAAPRWWCSTSSTSPTLPG